LVGNCSAQESMVLHAGLSSLLFERVEFVCHSRFIFFTSVLNLYVFCTHNLQVNMLFDTSRHVTVSLEMHCRSQCWSPSKIDLLMMLTIPT